MAERNLSGSRQSRKPKNIKHYNQRLILSLLKEHESLRAGEISEKINLSITTVTKILSELQSHGLVKSLGKGSSTTEGGKKPELFALNEDYRYVIAVNLGPVSLQYMLLDLKCHVRYRNEYPYQNKQSYSQCLRDIVASIDCCLCTASLKPEQICSIAITCEGITDGETGTLRRPVHTHFPWGDDLPLAADLSALLSFSPHIILENGCRLSGYAELLPHPEYGEECVVSIWADEATGGSVLQHGKLIQGINGLVGEIGHIIMEPSSQIRCSCGNYGCFETLVSSAALLRYAQRLLPQHPDSTLADKISSGQLSHSDIFTASNEGDSLSRAVLDLIIRYFTILIRNIVLLHNPQTVVIQGFYNEAGPYFLNRLQKSVVSSFSFQLPIELNIVYSQFDDVTGFLIGSALYSIDSFLNSEDLLKQ